MWHSQLGRENARSFEMNREGAGTLNVNACAPSNAEVSGAYPQLQPCNSLSLCMSSFSWTHLQEAFEARCNVSGSTFTFIRLV
jgi:hypothetical protein